VGVGSHCRQSRGESLICWLVVSMRVVFHCVVRCNLRSRSRLSSFTLQSARALFPPLGSHLGLLLNLLVDCHNGFIAGANGLEQVLTFA
jgi:hypothetical protein